MPDAFEPEEFKGMLFHDGVDSQGRPVIVVNTDAVGTTRQARSQALQYMLHRLEPIVTQVCRPECHYTSPSSPCYSVMSLKLSLCTLIPIHNVAQERLPDCPVHIITIFSANLNLLLSCKICCTELYPKADTCLGGRCRQPSSDNTCSAGCVTCLSRAACQHLSASARCRDQQTKVENVCPSVCTMAAVACIVLSTAVTKPSYSRRLEIQCWSSYLHHLKYDLVYRSPFSQWQYVQILFLLDLSTSTS